MGFDISGTKPEGEPGSYFRNNGNLWLPLWSYICQNCKFLTDEEIDRGYSNSYEWIDEASALRIADRLDERLATGEVTEYEIYFNRVKDTVPDKTCHLCEGGGKWLDAAFKAAWARAENLTEAECENCPQCNGTGKLRPFERFFTENVQEFAIFCRASGGFYIG